MLSGRGSTEAHLVADLSFPAEAAVDERATFGWRVEGAVLLAGVRAVTRFAPANWRLALVRPRSLGFASASEGSGEGSRTLHDTVERLAHDG